MSAKLKLDGSDTEYDVIQISYSIHQPKDFKTGKPSAEVNKGSLNMTVEAGAGTELIEWAIDNHGKKNGTVTFSKFDEEGTLRELKFEDGYLTGFSESMSNNGKLSTTLEVSTRVLNIGDAKIESRW